MPADAQSSQLEREFRACGRDRGDQTADCNVWKSSAAEAVDDAKELFLGSEPRYDTVYIERREVGAPERHLTIRHVDLKALRP